MSLIQSTSQSPWYATAVTLFPEMFPGPLGYSILGNGLDQDLWRLDTVQIRDHALDKHATVDDTPYGGGAGMVMKVDVVDRALETALERQPGRKLIYMSPRGKPLTQAYARHLVHDYSGIILLCGRFEGVDQRVIDTKELEEISIGDYILTGGEIPALVLLDVCARLIPGVIGKQESLVHESFENGLLEYPQYTRPQSWKNKIVPEVLLSGDHQRIADWRQDQAEKITQMRRPDLWQKHIGKK
ncbi:tRNA (guanosine(37)-N1)-methyltransferase TrmD [Candidatus Paracaedibacter symbiosus]|uniref:tRNA (guanosine(37)-N1)-methyltransferase TrmD n=1 Tax=Candidatus Paracaedibacter symbiosus TaxID=244582 RepID=UPI00068F96F5|nr:tRNA (guanosine(37)-N1)-methyltransferase TrmD [Candidatus Paracaedibacter symbiosus]